MSNWINNRYVYFILALMLSMGMSSCSVTQDKSAASAATQKGSFTNPLFPNGADPWLEYWDGNYYLTTTTWTSELVMRKSPTLAGLATATPVNVWSATEAQRCCNFWAFEFHRLKGPEGYRWYMMYTAGQDGTLDYQHLNVLESAGDDPMGPYEYKGAMMPDVWNIDGNYLQYKDKLYLIYSQWQGDEQRNLITEMDTPWSLKPGARHVILTRPEFDWETSERKVTEGAEILQHQGRTFMTYSGSFCDTPDYKLGLLELVGDDPMDPASWHKSPTPVFERTDTVFGPGHNGFFRSPDGTEDWLVYHANELESQGCGASRSLRAQKFSWKADGNPDFGKPITPGVVVAPPSGEDGPLETLVQGQTYSLVNAVSQACLDADRGNAQQAACSAMNNDWVLDPTSEGYYRLAKRDSRQFLEVAECSKNDGAVARLAPWQNNNCQQWMLDNSEEGLFTISNRATGLALALASCGSESGEAVVQSAQSTCQQWRLQASGQFVLLSQQSGKTVSLVRNTDHFARNIEQSAWTQQATQIWQMSPTDAGFVQFKNASVSEFCMGIAQNAVVPGANVELQQCDAPTSQWRLQAVTGGGFNVINRYTKQALNLANCGLAEGTNLAQAPLMNTNCQVFHLRSPQ